MKELSRTELMLMRRVWSSEGPISATKVYEEVKEKYQLDINRRTLGTLFYNLLDKGYVTVAYTQGKTNYYVPAVSVHEAQKRKLRDVLRYWFDESAEDLRSALYEVEEDEREADREAGTEEA